MCIRDRTRRGWRLEAFAAGCHNLPTSQQQQQQHPRASELLQGRHGSTIHSTTAVCALVAGNQDGVSVCGCWQRYWSDTRPAVREDSGSTSSHAGGRPQLDIDRGQPCKAGSDRREAWLRVDHTRYGAYLRLRAFLFFFTLYGYMAVVLLWWCLYS